MITAKINVSAIDKAKLFKGAKGTYLDIVLIDTPNGQYGDYMIVQGSTKEEREAGKKGAILGNAKILQSRGEAPRQQSRPAPPAAPVAGDGPPESDDVPF